MEVQGSSPAAPDCDFASLCDLVERSSLGESPNARWRIHLRLDEATGRHFLRAIKGCGDGMESEPVEGTDFDGAANRLAPRLIRRGAILALTHVARVR